MGDMVNQPGGANNGVQVVGGSNPLTPILLRYTDLLAPAGVSYRLE